ncbi:hypothetical protein K3727_09395 [Rhodobacteraceae bacterium M382]|nr:hypothetical protein K3727_09395 [Rhodobacteraceae bacterium M382]
MPKSTEIPLPPLPSDAPGIPKGTRYKPQFGVIVLVEDEPKQKALFDRLIQDGHRCKVVTT